MKPQEPIPHNYAMSRLNAIFAVSAILLLLATGLSVLYDYVRGWKFFQVEFMQLEADRIEQDLKSADDAATKKKLADLDQRTKEQQVEIARHRGAYVAAQKELDEWEGKHYAADQDYRFAKAHLDAQRYIAEASVVEHRPDARQQQAEYVRQQAHLADLNLRLQQAARDRDAARARVDDFLGRVTDLETKKKEMTANIDLLNKQLENVTRNKRTIILNLPLLDFINPTFKIDQVVLGDLSIDMNYMTVPRVDRCQTCHRAIDRPGFESRKEAARLQAELRQKLARNQIVPAKRKETQDRIAQLKRIEDAPQEVLNPYRTHPKLDVFVGSASPHPLLEYGCTVCHRGQDRATEFGRAGHTPPNRKMERRWEKAMLPFFPGWWDYKNRNWGYASNPFLETPMYPRQYYEAGCLKCHGSQMQIDDGAKITEATHMVELYGCHACHKIGDWRFEGLQKPGPTLDHIAEKVTPEWALRWIADPRGFKSTTRMPAFFYQRNIIGPKVPVDEREQNIRYQNAEIHAIVTYLFNHSTKRRWLGPNSGDAARGKNIVESVGCLACHINSESFTDKDGKTRIAHRDDYPLERSFGYNLANVGTKTYPGWIYNWVKNPHNYDPNAPMPSLRLSDEEAADVTAYIMTLQKPQFMKTPVRPPDPAAVRSLTKSYLINTLSDRDAEAKLDSMPLEEQLDYLGQRSIEKYGCYSCHEIKGFEDLKPIGTELTTEGSKAIHLFDFGFVHDYKNEEDGKTEHVIDTVPSWVYNKLRSPRVYDDERTKIYNDKLKMPNFGLTPHEAELITSVVLGMTKEKVTANRLASMDARSRIIEEGRKLVSQRNCRGCHVVDGTGRAIAALIKDPNFLPPDLSPEGGRGQSPWLFNFLKDPTVMKVRPWMAVRMPTFQFSDDEANRLVLMFSSEGKVPAFDTMQHLTPPPRNVAIGREVFSMLRCGQCHVTTPVADPSNPPIPKAADTTSLAPNLTLSKVRLRHDWIAEWIRRPNEMIPGTRMPTNFPRAETGEFKSPLANAIDTPQFAAHKVALLPWFQNEEELRTAMGDAVALTGFLRDYIWSIGIPGTRPPLPMNVPPAVTLPQRPNTPPPTPVQTGEMRPASH